MQIRLNKKQWGAVAKWWDNVGEKGDADGGIILDNKYFQFERVKNDK